MFSSFLLIKKTMKNNYLFTSESVSEGHPDKVCDRISDMVVDLYLSQDPVSRVACETLTTTNKVVLAGETRGPKINKDDLISKMIQIYETTSKNGILKVLRSHPKLAVEKNLTDYSNKEQSRANLKNCSQEEFDEFEKLNNEYEKKFGFPFIMAVKGKDKIEILNNFRQRINNDVELEFKEAKSQVKKIALFRLNEIFTK